MNSVPWKYRNAVNPWMDPKEILKATRFIDRMFRERPEEEILALLRTNEADRDWSKPQ